MNAGSDESTLGFTAGTRPRSDPRFGSGDATAVTTLTILLHPRWQRVGEHALLSELATGQAAELHRLAPEFTFAGSGRQGEPLADRHLSRRGLRIRPGPGTGVTLDPADGALSVEVDGRRLDAPLPIHAARLEAGVVLVLGRRVVLWLHRSVPPPRDPSDEAGDLGLIGRSGGVARLRAEIRRVADLTIPVLLHGDTGTGKELVARAIHSSGPRRRAPFVAVNLGALPPSLAAAELFGATRGAYTGAVAGQEGFFRRAKGGTLLLDEIGEAPAEVQAMLLRTLETGEVVAVGSQAIERVDVRVLAATDADLDQRVEAGTFRAPLLHRLASYELWLPALAHRREDLGLLLLHFLRQELAAVGEEGRWDEADTTRWLPPTLVARLAAYGWPGNVRQLRNVVRQLVVGSRGLPVLGTNARLDALLAPHTAAAAAEPLPEAPRRRPAEVDDDELLATLRETRFDLAAAARRLGVSRPSLYNRIAASGRLRTAGEVPAAEILEAYAAVGGDLDALSLRLEVSREALRRRVRELGLDA